MLQSSHNVLVRHSRLDGHLLLLEHHLLTVEFRNFALVHLHFLECERGSADITSLLLGERLRLRVLNLILHHLNPLLNRVTLPAEPFKRRGWVLLLGLSSSGSLRLATTAEHLLEQAHLL